MDKIPPFEDLPLRKDDPPLNAWGLYGDVDQLGFMNRVTDESVLNASKEIKAGSRISLNWPLAAQPTPGFSRQPFHHHIHHKAPRTVNDDIWTLNTQSSSQWDGLRHYGYQSAQRFYNNVTADAITSPNSTVNGMHHWAAKGIVGRGILLDFAAWREHKVSSGEDPDGRLVGMGSFKSSVIRLQDLLDVAAWEGVSIQKGDILLIRSGYIRDYDARLKSDPDGVHAHVKQQPPACIGVERSEAMLKFIWENFVAVAGDQPAFEVCPFTTCKTEESGKGEGRLGDLALHEVLLGGWGCPIGELWDLEALSEECRRLGRWSFMVVSEPVMVVGAVASPPNALALF